MKLCDGAEIYELAGLYLLNRSGTVINKNGVGYYKDFAAINNHSVQWGISPPQKNHPLFLAKLPP